MSTSTTSHSTTSPLPDLGTDASGSFSVSKSDSGIHGFKASDMFAGSYNRASFLKGFNHVSDTIGASSPGIT